jgi:hypothetical protein
MILAIPRQLILPETITPPRPLSWEGAVACLLNEAPLVQQRLLRYAGIDVPVALLLDDVAIESAIRRAFISLASRAKIKTYVINAHGTREVAVCLWRNPTSVSSPESLAATGVLIVTRDLVPPALYGSEFFGSPIYIDQVQFEEIVHLRDPATEAEVTDEARTIVSEVQAGPAGRIKKADFMRRLKDRCGHVPQKILTRVWRSKVVPAAWRARGRWT